MFLHERWECTVERVHLCFYGEGKVWESPVCSNMLYVEEASVQVPLGVLSLSRVDTCTFLASNGQKEIEEAEAYVHTKDISVIYLFLVQRL